MNEWLTMISRNMQQTIDIQAFKLGENGDNRPTVNNYTITIINNKMTYHAKELVSPIEVNIIKVLSDGSALLLLETL